jgi:hypothetical protein
MFPYVVVINLSSHDMSGSFVATLCWAPLFVATGLSRVLDTTALNIPPQCVAGWSVPTLLHYWLGASVLGNMVHARSIRWPGEFRGTA